ncbi:hypothetical protein LCGC14_1145510 [marine sediment metagenome]|uniref:Uncharacterized protein n=1 Tax=marine sediment metagenome TaxID=412755 RepID=A0A0F9LWZ5_9ZZZZ
MKETKYKTVSLPKGLADDVKRLIDELGYWPSLSAFVREATLEKLRKERSRSPPGKIVEEPIVAFCPERE